MPTQTIALFADALPLAYRNDGAGRPFLLLHGGAGPASMMGLAALSRSGRTVTPTHPGFDGQPRPRWFHTIDDLVLAYLALIEKLDLNDVVVVGNSVGGWLAAELGLRASPRISALVLLCAVGLDPAGSAIVDPAKLERSELLSLSFHDPRNAATPANANAAATLAANQRELRVYAGEPFMHDPGLRARLPDIGVPTLALWGESDRIVTPAYGRQFADLIPGARFELVAKAGHLPQIEQLDAVTTAIQGFV